MLAPLLDFVDTVLTTLIVIARRDPKAFAKFASRLLLGYIVIGAVALAAHYAFSRPATTTTSFATQLKSLRDTEASLTQLLRYVSDQKAKVQESQQLLESLQREKSMLEPLVKADRQIIDSFFTLQQEKARREKYLGYVASFVLGVLSSLAAAAIAYAIRSARHRVATIPARRDVTGI